MPQTPQPADTPLSSKVNAFTTPIAIKKPDIPSVVLENKESVILDSSTINKADLLPVETVLAKYSKLKTAGKAGPLAVKLAREGIFLVMLPSSNTLCMDRGDFQAYPSLAS